MSLVRQTRNINIKLLVPDAGQNLGYFDHKVIILWLFVVFKDMLRDFVADFAVFKQKWLWNEVKKTILVHVNFCQHKRAIICF